MVGREIMSRIGKQPIDLPPGVEVTMEKSQIAIKGPQGHLTRSVPDLINVILEDHKILVDKKVESKQARSLHGLMRTLIFNMVKGVADGFQKQLVVSGLGYRVQMQGKNLQLAIGYSQPVIVPPPPGIEFEVGQRNLITVRGANKEQVGQVAAEIRGLRPPEPYKGAGIAYANETVRRKVGKAGV
jgi:large subunit ribosomal protein L6